MPELRGLFMMNEKEKEDMREAKRRLYRRILYTPNKDLTDNEKEIGCLLAKDKQIQEILEKTFKGS